MRLEDAFLLHLAELVGKRGAVDAQVVRELLPVEGDRERVAPRLIAWAERYESSFPRMVLGDV